MLFTCELFKGGVGSEVETPAVVVERLEAKLALMKDGVAQHVLSGWPVVVVGHLNSPAKGKRLGRV